MSVDVVGEETGVGVPLGIKPWGDPPYENVDILLSSSTLVDVFSVCPLT